MEQQEEEVELGGGGREGGGSELDEITQGVKEIRLSRGKGLPDIRADQKILHCAWHPFNPQVAVAGQAGLYFYNV